MKKIKLGNTDIKISKQGFGAMGMSEFYGSSNLNQNLKILELAIKNGVNFIDTADIYGYGQNEKLLGEFLNNRNNDNIILATKCGIIRDKNDSTKRGINNSYDYIIECCENSLNRLNHPIDLFYLHRVINDDLIIDGAMKAMAYLLKNKKIKSVGVSEASVDYIKKANEKLMLYTDGEHQISAVQSEYSLLTKKVEKNGVLDICKKLGITFVAYSPLCRGMLTDGFSVNSLDRDDFRLKLPRFSPENIKHNLIQLDRLKEFAKNKNCTLSQLSLAWLMNKSKNIVPIPGTRREKYLLQNIEAMNINLTQEEIKLLDEISDSFTISGSRYTKEAMKIYKMEE